MNAVYGDFVSIWYNPSTRCIVNTNRVNPQTDQKLSCWIAKEPTARVAQFFVIIKRSDAPLLGPIWGVTADTIKNNALPSFVAGHFGIWLSPDVIGEVNTQHYKIGDTVEVNVYNDLIVSRADLAGKLEKHKIIGLWPNLTSWDIHYALEFEPDGIQGGYIVNNEKMEIWHIAEEYRNKRYKSAAHIRVMRVSAGSSKVSGMSCMNRFCKERSPYAEGPNCPNNVFMCYSCRHNPITYALVMNERTPNA